jgi:hypothetical protein
MRLTVHVSAVADTVDTYDANLIGDLVNHAVVAYADAPVVLAPGQFAATGRARVCRQCPNRRNDPVVNLRGEP